MAWIDCISSCRIIGVPVAVIWLPLTWVNWIICSDFLFSDDGLLGGHIFSCVFVSWRDVFGVGIAIAFWLSGLDGSRWLIVREDSFSSSPALFDCSSFGCVVAGFSIFGFTWDVSSVCVFGLIAWWDISFIGLAAGNVPTFNVIGCFRNHVGISVLIGSYVGGVLNISGFNCWWWHVVAVNIRWWNIVGCVPNISSLHGWWWHVVGVGCRNVVSCMNVVGLGVWCWNIVSVGCWNVVSCMNIVSLSWNIICLSVGCRYIVSLGVRCWYIVGLGVILGIWGDDVSL